jgi:hypothetical protein
MTITRELPRRGPCGGEWHRASGALPGDPADLIFKIGMQVLIFKSADLIFAGELGMERKRANV